MITLSKVIKCYQIKSDQKLSNVLFFMSVVVGLYSCIYNYMLCNLYLLDYTHYMFRTAYSIIFIGLQNSLYLLYFRIYYVYRVICRIKGCLLGFIRLYQALNPIVSIGLHILLYLLDFKSQYICQALHRIISARLYIPIYLLDFKSEILFGLWMQGHKALTERSVVKVATKWQGCVGYADLT